MNARTHRFSQEELTRFEPRPDRPAPVRVERSTDITELSARKGRKSTKVMIAGMSSVVQRADYGLGRIRRLEEQISAVLNDVGPDARKLMIAERPSLAHYVVKSN